jgi:hypothetical protein
MKSLKSLEELYDEYRKISNQRSDLKDKINEALHKVFIKDHFTNSTWEFDCVCSSGQIIFESFQDNKFSFLEDEIRLGCGDKIWRKQDKLILSIYNLERLIEYIEKYKLKIIISNLNRKKLENELESIQEILKLCK